MRYPFPDRFALQHRAVEADAVSAVGRLALRRFEEGDRDGAYTALLARRREAHPLVLALLDEPELFAHPLEGVVGRARGPERPFGEGYRVRTRWVAPFGVPLVPLQNVVYDPAAPDELLAEVPLDARLRRWRSLGRVGIVASLAGAIAAGLFLVWPRTIVVHNPYDDDIRVEIGASRARLEPHETYAYTAWIVPWVAVRATTLQGDEIDGRDIAPARQLRGFTVWNPGGRGLYYVEEIVYGDGEDAVGPELLASEPVQHTPGSWAFDAAPDSLDIGGAASARRERVGCVFDDEPKNVGIEEQATWLYEQGLGELVPAFVDAELRVFPGNEGAARLLDDWLTPEEAVRRWDELQARAPEAPGIQAAWYTIAPDRAALRAAADVRAREGTPLARALWSEVAPDPAVALAEATAALAAAPGLPWAHVAHADALQRTGDEAGAARAWALVHTDDPDLRWMARREQLRLAWRAGVAPEVAVEILEEDNRYGVAEVWRAAAAPASLPELLGAADPDAHFFRLNLTRAAGDAAQARLALNALRGAEGTGEWLAQAILVELGPGGSPLRLQTLLEAPDPTVRPGVARVAAALSRASRAPNADGWAAAADLRGDGGPSFAELLALDTPGTSPAALAAWPIRHHPHAALALGILAGARGDAGAQAAWRDHARVTALPEERVP